MKGNEDMIRIVAIAAAFLIMFGIIGLAIYSINSISKTNKEHEEREEGKLIAATIIQTTATTSVWDYIRASSVEAAATIAVESDVISSYETVSSEENSVEMPVSNAPSDQTITVTVPFVEGAA